MIRRAWRAAVEWAQWWGSTSGPRCRSRSPQFGWRCEMRHEHPGTHYGKGMQWR